tara:strand:- start:388 stop:888 length:501 start_codon:yes stop_codon:yes gene_type:complete
MSFQKAHNISNELGEIVLSELINIDTNVTTTGYFSGQPFMLNKNFRILEVGFTANGVTAVGTAIRVETVTNAAQVDIVCDNQSIPVLQGPNLATGAIGQTISTNKSDSSVASGWTFNEAALTTVLDADGVPRLLAGQALRYVTSAHAGTGWGHLFVRLAPETIYKD